MMQFPAYTYAHTHAPGEFAAQRDLLALGLLRLLCGGDQLALQRLHPLLQLHQHRVVALGEAQPLLQLLLQGFDLVLLMRSRFTN